MEHEAFDSSCRLSEDTWKWQPTHKMHRRANRSHRVTGKSGDQAGYVIPRHDWLRQDRACGYDEALGRQDKLVDERGSTRTKPSEKRNNQYSGRVGVGVHAEPRASSRHTRILDLFRLGFPLASSETPQSTCASCSRWCWGPPRALCESSYIYLRTGATVGSTKLSFRCFSH